MRNFLSKFFWVGKWGIAYPREGSVFGWVVWIWVDRAAMEWKPEDKVFGFISFKKD